MKSNSKHFLLLGLLSTITACSASGFTGLETVVTGPISVVDPITGNAIAGTSAKSPYLASNGGFSIGLTEGHYSGPYTVTQYSFGGIPGYSFNYSCFEPHTIDSFDKINIVRFQIDGAPPVPTPNASGVTPAPPPNPCMSGEQETYLIQDTHGHEVYFYLEIP